MKLPRVVVALGAVSLLTDIASEMVYPLLPTLLAGLGAGAVSLGAVEGVGDATAAIVKLVSGRLSDRTSRRKPLVLAGYGLSATVRALLAVAQAPWQVVGVRFLDRIGKGIRSSPRDALLAGSVARANAAAAFGFHRAMDNVGATVGPLLVVLLLGAFGGDVRRVLWASVAPGLLALAVIVAFVREAPTSPPTEGPAERADAGPSAVEVDAVHSSRAPSALRGYLMILGLFALANTSDLFLLARLGELGATPRETATAWAVLNGVRALAGYPGGRLADRLGRARAMMAGWALYAASYAAMATAADASSFAGALVVYGLFYGLTEGAERAIVAQLAPKQVLGSAFGRFHLVTGLAMLPSNLLFGAAWQRFGGPACLGASAVGAVVCIAALALWSRRFVTPAT